MTYSQTTAFGLLNEPHQRLQNLVDSTEVLPVTLMIHYHWRSQKFWLKGSKSEKLGFQKPLASLKTFLFVQFCWVLHKLTSWEWKGVDL